MLVGRITLLLGLLAVLRGFKSQSAVPLRMGMNAWPGCEFLSMVKEINFVQAEVGSDRAL